MKVIMESVKVFDTWLKASRRVLHFDVMTRDEPTSLRLANDYPKDIRPSP